MGRKGNLSLVGCSLLSTKKSALFLNFLFLVVSILFFPGVLADDTNTTIYVPNSPPVFEGIIPNFSWPGGIMENIMDLDDYFYDLQDDLIFTLIGSGNVSMIVDSENLASFIPESGFLGLEGFFIVASDGEFNVSSNEFFIGIGVDITPPTWLNPRKSKNKDIYQNDFITFNVDWHDDFGLKEYYLEIDQLGEYEKFFGNFSGMDNVSENKIQIKAPAGKIVRWRVCASDISGNWACTDIYDFFISKPKPIPPTGDDSSPSAGTGNGDGEGDGDSSLTGESVTDLYEDAKDFFKEEKEDFSLSVDSFLINLKQGTSRTQVFEIINTGTTTLDFKLMVNKIEDMVLLSDKEFILEAGESKTITLDFKVDLSTEVGQHYGELIIQSISTVVIPLVIEVNDANLEFDVEVEVLEEYKNVKPGKVVVANLNISNYGDKILSDVKVVYAIKDFYGNIHDAGEEILSFDTNLELEKELMISENAKLGKYLFYVSVENEKDMAIDSDIFVVGLSFRFEAFLKSSLIFIVIFVLSAISIVLSMRYSSQKKKERALNLYVKLTEMKEMIKNKNYDKAATLYIAIKKIYGERVDPDLLKDRSRLIESIKDLSSKIVFEEEPVSSEKEGEENENSQDKKDDSEKSDESKGSEENSQEKASEESDSLKEKKENSGEEVLENQEKLEEVSTNKLIEEKDVSLEKDIEEGVEKEKIVKNLKDEKRVKKKKIKKNSIEKKKKKEEPKNEKEKK